MSDDLRPLGDEDPSADTERFRRFATDADPATSAAPGGSSATTFRIVAFLAGLVVLALLVWLLFSL